MQEELKLLFKSIFISTVVAICIGIGVGLITTWRIGIGSVVLMVIAQFAFSYMASIIREKRKIFEMDNVIIEALTNAKKHRTLLQLNCAYCSAQNTVATSLSEPNSFKCKSCNQPNKVHMQLTASRITQPISSPVDTAEINMDDAEISKSTINENIIVS